MLKCQNSYTKNYHINGINSKHLLLITVVYFALLANLIVAYLLVRMVKIKAIKKPAKYWDLCQAPPFLVLASWRFPLQVFSSSYRNRCHPNRKSWLYFASDYKKQTGSERRVRVQNIPPLAKLNHLPTSACLLLQRRNKSHLQITTLS